MNNLKNIQSNHRSTYHHALFNSNLLFIFFRPISTSNQTSTHSQSTPTSDESIPVDEQIIILSSLDVPRSTIEYDTPITEVQESIENLLDQCCRIVSESNKSPTFVNDESAVKPAQSNRDSKRHRKIVKLERRLSRLSKVIHDLEQKDMSLDEMAHCDLYVVESNLKKRACEVSLRNKYLLIK